MPPIPPLLVIDHQHTRLQEGHGMLIANDLFKHGAYVSVISVKSRE
jgi:hypothetical protein